MKLHKRAAKLVLAAIPIEPESSEEDCDDEVVDPSYKPVEEYEGPRSSSPNIVEQQRQRCEYANCSSEVFSACFKCNSFLCWNHFEDPAFANDCSKHNTSSECLMNLELNDLLMQQNTPAVNPSHVTCASHSRTLACPDPCLQKCEYLLCSGDVVTTCTSCHSFLCTAHYEDACASRDCSKHRPFSMSAISTSKSKKSHKETSREAMKRKRNTGQEYTNYKKEKVEARSMKPPCTKCRFKCIEKVNEKERQEIFDKYWGLGDSTRQKDFILYSTETVANAKKQCDECDNNTKKRGPNYAFYFEVNSKKIRVCKEFFKATLDINDRVIATVRDKVTKHGYVTEDLRGKHQKTKLLDERQEAHDFINAIPRIESHYLRAQTTREYIEGGKTLNDIFNDYKAHCVANSKKHVSKSTFCSIFHTEFNISFFVPKKDRCELCVSYENSNKEEQLAMQEEYETHLKEKKTKQRRKGC